MSGALAGRRILVVGAGTRSIDDPDAPIGNGRAISVVAGRAGATVDLCRRRRGGRRPDRGHGRGRGLHGPRAGRRRHRCRHLRRASSRLLPPRWAASTGSSSTSASARGWGCRAPRPSSGTPCSPSTSGRTSCSRPRRCEVMPEGGSIVFISSIAGLTPGSRIPAYDASKAALTGPLPPGRRRRRPQGDPCQRRRARPDRHAARAPRHRGPPVTRQGARAARAAGHGVGGRRAGRLPPQRRRQLHHQPAPRRRRRPHRSTRLGRRPAPTYLSSRSAGSP